MALQHVYKSKIRTLQKNFFARPRKEKISDFEKK